ncbi:MFS transporter [Allokutzneria sp. A3M-2-11 16]|uniref:MFS transporter n=1 Tax=Allokutzneria sp. A3M-2-11 16 TaxID=2962043 RepID=UPI0020B81C0A|nr:MFS transporter [Allokutzneria sp. A3M-2-11 16]MCP3802859.1 MFS transporter [Allokutzneria sp. A3M-2-11 16]
MTDTTRAGRREWLGLAVLVLPVLLISLDNSVLFIALPVLTTELRPSADEMLWIMDAYPFLLAGLLITMGTLGDRIGRRRLLVLGGAAFGLASVVAAFAPTPGLLIAARALMGIGGATLMPSTLSLIRDLFADPTQRTTAIGVWGAGFGGGAMLGPIIGGVLLEHFDWGSVFLINVPVMVLLLIAGPLLLKESRDPNPGRFDLLGAAMSLAAVLPAIYGVKKIAADGFAVSSVLAIVFGVAMGVAFVRRQRRQADPLLDLRLFSSGTFRSALAANALTLFGMIGLSLFTSQYMQVVLGMSPLSAALWSIPGMAASVVGAVLAPRLVRWVDLRTLILGGLGVGASGFLLLVWLSPQDGLFTMLAGSAILAGGFGTVATLGTDLILTAVPRERAGAASALSETGNEFGGALGIAVLGSLGTAVYRANLPAGVPSQVTESVAGAVGTPALAAARIAFTSAIHVVAVVGVGISLIVMLGVYLGLDRSKPPVLSTSR